MFLAVGGLVGLNPTCLTFQRAEPWEVKMKDHSQYQRRAWALLIVLSSFVAAAAVWTLPEDGETKPSPAFRPG